MSDCRFRVARCRSVVVDVSGGSRSEPWHLSLAAAALLQRRDRECHRRRRRLHRRGLRRPVRRADARAAHRGGHAQSRRHHRLRPPRRRLTRWTRGADRRAHHDGGADRAVDRQRRPHRHLRLRQEHRRQSAASGGEARGRSRRQFAGAAARGRTVRQRQGHPARARRWQSDLCARTRPDRRRRDRPVALERPRDQQRAVRGDADSRRGSGAPADVARRQGGAARRRSNRDRVGRRQRRPVEHGVRPQRHRAGPGEHRGRSQCLCPRHQLGRTGVQRRRRGHRQRRARVRRAVRCRGLHLCRPIGERRAGLGCQSVQRPRGGWRGLLHQREPDRGRGAEAGRQRLVIGVGRQPQGELPRSRR